MKRLILMGASGSIGTQTIDVIKEHEDQLELVGVSVGKNVEYLEEILSQFDIRYAYTIEEIPELMKRYPEIRFYSGDQGLVEMARLSDYDMLVNALVGFTGFKPTLEAIRNHKDIALANKETLVAGGKIINEALKEYNVHLYPIDSEHVAIWQCLQGHPKKDVRRLILTASGGAFRDLDRNDLLDVTLKQALNHPVWSMGSKITIDSASMMNKGFEIIEAHYLFDLPYDQIDVILHKEAAVHSMVEYNDGSIIAQMGNPDMRLMIKYALMYPEHKWDHIANYLDFDKITSLNFRKMDYSRYPLVKLAKQVGSFEGNFGAVLIGANDEAVALFTKERIPFVDIESYIFKTLKAARFIKDPTADQIIESHRWAKEYVDKLWANS
ncbi:MAG: 1-deoxy-D-xylulose-5-phosphate reductoisomerase [Erysipelotrichaceae bacterium]|nr:1-deoxy-D-xylulose-5-phosphate reductoisomerase [Erysipelotrichaceae bacterium]MCR5095687.1 1-deoxy-D-xylulose-5-phosphate reductoisomerase [Erysipelotrichaceae bacterium]